MTNSLIAKNAKPKGNVNFIIILFGIFIPQLEDHELFFLSNRIYIFFTNKFNFRTKSLVFILFKTKKPISSKGYANNFLIKLI